MPSGGLPGSVNSELTKFRPTQFKAIPCASTRNDAALGIQGSDNFKYVLCGKWLYSHWELGAGTSWNWWLLGTANSPVAHQSPGNVPAHGCFVQLFVGQDSPCECFTAQAGSLTLPSPAAYCSSNTHGFRFIFSSHTQNLTQGDGNRCFPDANSPADTLRGFI